ncbi:hypothetical protein QQ39_11010 [Pragia fontium]|nr:hypothetical protein QQ39_11010 [Pragia fontium]
MKAFQKNKHEFLTIIYIVIPAKALRNPQKNKHEFLTMIYIVIPTFIPSSLRKRGPPSALSAFAWVNVPALIWLFALFHKTLPNGPAQVLFKMANTI